MHKNVNTYIDNMYKYTYESSSIIISFLSFTISTRRVIGYSYYFTEKKKQSTMRGSVEEVEDEQKAKRKNKKSFHFTRLKQGDFSLSFTQLISS